LRYLEKLPLLDKDISHIVEYLGSREALYDYQLFEIVRWFVQACLSPPPELIDLCRKWWSDRNRAPFLRTWSLALLGAFGEISDLENIEQSYGASNTELENAEIVQSWRMQKLLPLCPAWRSAGETRSSRELKATAT
jgi:hypothetical protein